MGSPIDVGGSTPSSHFSPLLGLVVNFCYGVMKPVLRGSRVLGSNPGCLSFIQCVDFVHSAFQLQVGCLCRAGRICSTEEYPGPRFP